jgi:hypothetical protein
METSTTLYYVESNWKHTMKNNRFSNLHHGETRTESGQTLTYGSPGHHAVTVSRMLIKFPLYYISPDAECNPHMFVKVSSRKIYLAPAARSL